MKSQRAKTYLPVVALAAALILLLASSSALPLPRTALPQRGSGDLPKPKRRPKRTPPRPTHATRRQPAPADDTTDDDTRADETPVDDTPLDPREEAFAARSVPRIDSEAVELIRQNHVDGIDLSNRLGEDMRRLSSYLDPFSTYLTAEQVKEYRGGLNVGTTDFGALIAGTISPAYELALVKGGPGGRGLVVLWRLNRTDTKDLSLYDVRQLLSGAPGTKVKLDLERYEAGNGPARVTAVLTRDVLKNVPAEGRLKAGSVGVVTVGNLTDGEVNNIRARISELLSAGAKQILLDLRDVAGGSFEEGVRLANLFTGKGVLAKVTGHGGKVLKTISAVPDEVLFDGPLLVMINEGTAGPAELTALIIKERGRGLLANDLKSWLDRALRNHSFGAGGEQLLFTLKGGDGLLLTTEKWTAQSGIPFLKDGVRVDKSMSMNEAVEFLAKGAAHPSRFSPRASHMARPATTRPAHSLSRPPSCLQALWPLERARWAARKRPVWESGVRMISSGVPVATTWPPASPPSGPRSMRWSAVLMTSRLCSMTRSEPPASTSVRKAASSLLMSSKWSPVVGSSKM
jgi:carboxyl-terminal processing protease